MDLDQIVDAVRSGVTPLIRTDYSDDDAWRLVVSQATRIRVEVVGTPLEWEADLRSLWEWDVVRLATRD